MDTETTLHFFCGKMAAGKSTLAKELASRHDAILLTEDDWLAQLYPEEITDIPSYIKYSARLKNSLSEHILLLLSRGLSVVLDFPANTKSQRSWFRSIFVRADVAHVLHFIDASDQLCKQQLQQRSKDKPQGAAFTSEADFDAITEYFQAPLENEGFNLVRYQPQGS
jgi:predicted kinase